MALGSQKWNGAWADLVNAPSSTRTMISGKRGLVTSAVLSATSALIEKVPAVTPIRMMPAKSARPPPTVTRSDCSAALRAAALVLSKPTSRKERRLVISQKTKTMIRLSASTVPSIAVMKSRM